MNYYYHNSIKNYTIALLDLFNDIRIPRFTEDGERISDTIIPVKFGNRDKAYILQDYNNENLLNGNINTLPRMVIEFNSMAKAQERNTNKNHKINKRKKNNISYEFHYNAVAYDFEFTLHIATRTFTDTCIIIEQIAPMFRPDYTLRINELDIQEEPTAVPVQIGDFDTELPDIDPDEIRIVKTSLPVTLKGNLYLPIKDQSIIKEIELNMIAIEGERDAKGIEYEIEYKPSTISAKATDEQTKADIDDIKVTKEDIDIKPNPEDFV